MCNCRERIDAGLKPKNARLAFGFTFGDGVMAVGPPMILLEKIEKRRDGKKLPILLASFCPFCGEKVLSRDEEALLPVHKARKRKKVDPIPNDATRHPAQRGRQD